MKSGETQWRGDLLFILSHPLDIVYSMLRWWCTQKTGEVCKPERNHFWNLSIVLSRRQGEEKQILCVGLLSTARSVLSGKQSSGILSLKCVGGGVTIRNKVMAGLGFMDGQIWRECSIKILFTMLFVGISDRRRRRRIWSHCGEVGVCRPGAKGRVVLVP